jgi:hypothetical protein
MKTAMQELMEWFYNRPEYDKTSEGYEIMTMCEILLNVEKEQIIDARNDGIVSNIKGYCISNEEYYNQKYNPVRDESEEAFKHFADNADITITFNRNS